VVLALAANSIDPCRARLLIYGLAEQTSTAAIAAKGAAIEQTVCEAHEHEEGTLIGPTQ